MIPRALLVLINGHLESIRLPHGLNRSGCMASHPLYRLLLLNSLMLLEDKFLAGDKRMI